MDCRQLEAGKIPWLPSKAEDIAGQIDHAASESVEVGIVGSIAQGPDSHSRLEEIVLFLAHEFDEKEGAV